MYDLSALYEFAMKAFACILNEILYWVKLRSIMGVIEINMGLAKLGLVIKQERGRGLQI